MYFFQNIIVTKAPHFTAIECGFPNIWETELFDNVDYLKCVIKQRLENQFLQNWNSLVQNSPKAVNYKNCKAEY
jgi:hypothetical protein